MNEIRERACAKLNISLDVLRKRADGYHDMLMVMQSVSLCDEITLTRNDSGKIVAQSNLRYVPNDERNLAVKAALCFYRVLGRDCPGLHIRIKKQIPVGAGMAGGSADAAAVLRGLNRLHGEVFQQERLMEMGADVGSDVPFCILGGTALAEGRGEKLKALPPMPPCHILICKPEFSISTPELFQKLDASHTHRHPDTAGILKALEAGDLNQLCRRMYNVFEDVDDRRMRTIHQIKSAILDYGALSAMMTGTGSAVFGIFTEETAAREAMSAMKKICRFAMVAQPCD